MKLAGGRGIFHYQKRDIVFTLDYRIHKMLDEPDLQSGKNRPRVFSKGTGHFPTKETFFGTFVSF
jgi:hypothetical protein